MAERIVSPAVFTNEIDQSFLIESIGQIGGAVVGPFTKGPAYSPTIVRSVSELEDLFGVPDGSYYQPFTAREYLMEQGIVTIVRVGSLGGYRQNNALIIRATLDPLNSGSIDASEYNPAGDIIGVLANTLDPSLGELSNETEGFEGSEIVGGEVSATDKTATLVLQNNTYEFDDDGNRVITGTDFSEPYVFNINPRDPSSLQNIFGRAPQRNERRAYFHAYFEDTQLQIYNNIQAGATYTFSAEVGDEIMKFDPYDADPEAVDVDDDDPAVQPYNGAGEGEFSCRPANTPYIESQEIAGNRYKLFQVFTRNMGNTANRELKVGIYNVRTPGTLTGEDYGTFSLIVRGYGDSDRNQNVIEDFRDLSLNPKSPRFVARVIGDRFTFINSKSKIIERGDYANHSNWIRIRMNPESTAPSGAMPYGHGPYLSPLGGVDGDAPQPLWSYASQYGEIVGKYFSGTIFTQDSPDGLIQLPQGSKNTKELCSPIPDTPGSAGSGFHLDTDGSITTEVDGVVKVTPTAEGGVDTEPNGAAAELLARQHRRFLVGFQGGFDGHSPTKPINLGADITAKNVQGLDCSGRNTTGSRGYIRAFNALKNQDEFDINLLVTPGLSLDLHRSVINYGIDLCETREDAFYILDCVSANGQPGRVNDAVAQVSTVDSNYAATYYPWVKIIDPSTNALQAYPPSALMPAVYAANDKTAAEWFAPAGLNRGGLEQAVSVMDRLNFAERDDLYEGKVNPIAAFPGQGIVAFGQKTLQRRSSALDRVNVRRLLITLKKFIASTARFLIFEQNTAATRQRFLGIVNPYLESVQQRQGLYAFRVVMDDSNNTPDLIDRNILYGNIFLQPARAVEYIILDFTLQSTGASFG